MDPVEEFRRAAGSRPDSTDSGSSIIGRFDPAAGAVSVNPRIDAPDLTNDDLDTARRLVDDYRTSVTAWDDRAAESTSSDRSRLVLALAVGAAAVGLGGVLR